MCRSQIFPKQHPKWWRYVRGEWRPAYSGQRETSIICGFVFPDWPCYRVLYGPLRRKVGQSVWTHVYRCPTIQLLSYIKYHITKPFRLKIFLWLTLASIPSTSSSSCLSISCSLASSGSVSILLKTCGVFSRSFSTLQYPRRFSVRSTPPPATKKNSYVRLCLSLQLGHPPAQSSLNFCSFLVLVFDFLYLFIYIFSFSFVSLVCSLFSNCSFFLSFV